MSTAQATPQYRLNPDGSFMDYDQIVFDLFANLQNDDKKALAVMTEKEVRGLHHFWGMAIRNAYGMWDPTSPASGDRHPDDASNDIMVEVWNKVREIAS